MGTRCQVYQEWELGSQMLALNYIQCKLTIYINDYSCHSHSKTHNILHVHPSDVVSTSSWHAVALVWTRNLGDGGIRDR